MERETPAALGGRGVEMLPGDFRAPLTLATFRAQLIAARYALPLETAALVAALALGGAISADLPFAARLTPSAGSAADRKAGNVSGASTRPLAR